MDRRIETRVVETGKVDLTTIIQKNACEVWWISVSTKTNNSEGLVTIHDGFDAAGSKKWKHQLFTSAHFNFVPPIPCDQGITVVSNSNVEYYTIAFRPKSWKKEPQ